MQQPLVSVCIPSYNNAEFIEETILSVLEQSYSNIELIITDDASNDDTVKTINRVISGCSIPVRVEVSEENGGIASNWNHALSLAKGSYIKLLPADDVLHPDCIRFQVKQFEKYGNDIALVFSARSIVTRSGRALLTARFYRDQRVTNLQLIKRCILSGTNVIGEPGAVLFAKEISEKVGGFDGSKPYVIDLNYWARILQHGNAIALYQPLSTFRIDSNLSVRLGWRRLKEYSSMIDDMQQQWNLSLLLAVVGKCRALVNEMLRRIVHIVFRTVG